MYVVMWLRKGRKPIRLSDFHSYEVALRIQLRYPATVFQDTVLWNLEDYAKAERAGQ